MRAACAQRGFTLLEMLLAMALMVALAGALYASLSTGFRGRRVTEAALEPARRATAGLALIGSDLDSAVPPTGLLAGELRGQDARNEDGQPADGILFHALTTEQSGAAPPFPMRRVEISLAAEEGTDERVLLRRTTLNLLAPEQPEPLKEVICRQVRSFDVTYYDGYGWLESWDSTTAGDVLPLAVRVTLVVEADDREEGYEVSRVFALPCGETPGGEAPSGGPSGGVSR